MTFSMIYPAYTIFLVNYKVVLYAYMGFTRTKIFKSSSTTKAHKISSSLLLLNDLVLGGSLFSFSHDVVILVVYNLCCKAAPIQLQGITFFVDLIVLTI